MVRGIYGRRCGGQVAAQQAKIRREGDEIIHEWAFGTQKQIYKWNDRLDMNYVPYDHDLPVEMPLPPAEGPSPQEPIEPQQPME